MAAARGVELLVAPDMPTAIVDVSRLELILMNLVSNGIKYSDPAKAKRVVEVSAVDSAAPGECALVVRDNGLGIAEEHIGEIFNRFFRAHAELDRDLGIDGLGLGLSIVADCLKAIRGRIDVSSTIAAGTTFTVVFPAAMDRPEPEPR
jgi:signal transduction histidine kinase